MRPLLAIEKILLAFASDLLVMWSPGCNKFSQYPSKIRHKKSDIDTHAQKLLQFDKKTTPKTTISISRYSSHSNLSFSRGKWSMVRMTCSVSMRRLTWIVVMSPVINHLNLCTVPGDVFYAFFKMSDSY